jgi:ParB/RepB/Spo0J family partition protein
MTVATVKLNQIKVTKDWNRESVGDISELVMSIKETGQLQPLLVWQDTTSKTPVYYLIDGRRRFAALQVLKKDPLIVLSQAKDPASAFLQSMAANTVRENNTAYDISRSFDHLVESYGVIYEDIVKVCGKTSGYVSQHVSAIRIARKDPRLLEAFKTGQISLYVFRFLSRLDPQEDAKAFKKAVTDLLSGDSTTQDVRTYIDQYLAKKLQKAVKSGAAPMRGKKAKRDAQVEASLPDYASVEIRKAAKCLNKADILDRANTFRAKFLAARGLGMQRYYKGCLDALNFALSLESN